MLEYTVTGGSGLQKGCREQVGILCELIRRANGIFEVEGFNGPPRIKHNIVLYDLACEHASSIVSLVNIGNLGSAFTLIRSCIEVFVRAEWLLNASDEEAGAVFSSSKKWPPFKVMLKDVDRRNEAKNNYFHARYGKQSYGVMSDLTHGLRAHVDKRLAGKPLKFHACEEEILELVKECCFITLVSNLSLAGIVGNETQAEELSKLLHHFFSRYYNPFNSNAEAGAK